MTTIDSPAVSLLRLPEIQELLAYAEASGHITFQQINEVLGDLDLDDTGAEILLETLEERGVAVMSEPTRAAGVAAPRSPLPAGERVGAGSPAPRAPRKTPDVNELDDVLASLQEILGPPQHGGPADEEQADVDDEMSVEDAFKQYLNRMGQVPRLTAAEERKLAETARGGTGDEQVQAKQALVEANLRLVVHIASHYAKTAALPVLDIVQEGNIGLMRAVDRFDPRRGQRLSGYATWWIRQSITRALAAHARSMRLPSHLYQAIETLQRLQRTMTQELGRGPSRQELAAASGMTVVQVDEALRAAMQPMSLETPVGSSEASELGELLSNPEDEIAVTELSRGALHDLVVHAMEDLTERERAILMRRFGLEDYEGRGPQALDDVAAAMNLPPERVRQLEQRALRKLRRSASGKELEDVMDDGSSD